MQPMWKSHIVKQATGPDDPEFQATLQDALRQVSPDDVIAIADELAERHAQLFSQLIVDSAALKFSPVEIFSAVAHTHANAQFLVKYFSQSDDRVFEDLLYGEASAPVRVATFVERLSDMDTRLALELATGLLHNISPNDNWLWTRWLWDPTTGTGALPLLAGSTHNLLAENIADGYARVGTVTSMSMKVGEGTGLFTPAWVSDERRTPFANSAFLACVYCIYLYGTTSWRLSREFNRLMPTLPNMARRLLGFKKSKCLVIGNC
jgi:hypothetical protein